MKNFKIKTIATFLFILIGISMTFAQNDSITKSIKPFRLGVKIGVPNIATANAEYVTPLLNNRVAITADYMSLTKTINDTEVKYSNFEIGSNIYFNKNGKGFYGGVSYFSMDGKGTYNEIEFDDGSVEDATGTIKFNTVNLKLGVKLGRVFYFRLEVGYGFGEIPEQILVTSKTSSQTTYEDIPAIPGISSSGMPVFNFGIGFGFF